MSVENAARGEQPPFHVEDDLVGRSEEPLERHRALQEPMEPMLRGEAMLASTSSNVNEP